MEDTAATDETDEDDGVEGNFDEKNEERYEKKEMRYKLDLCKIYRNILNMKLHVFNKCMFFKITFENITSYVQQAVTKNPAASEYY